MWRSRGPCGLRGLWTRGSLRTQGDWGAGAECPWCALPVGSDSLRLALSSPCPGSHGGPQHVPALELQLQVEGVEPRATLSPASPPPAPPGPFQPKRWPGSPQGAPGPRGKSSGSRLPQEVQEVAGVTRGWEALEAVQTAPKALQAAWSRWKVARKGPVSPQLLWEQPALCTVPVASPRAKPSWAAAWQHEGSAPGPSQGQDHMHQPGGLCLFPWCVEALGTRAPWKPRNPDLTPLVALWWPLQCPPPSSGEGAAELWSGPTQGQASGRALQGPLHTLEPADPPGAHRAPGHPHP